MSQKKNIKKKTLNNKEVLTYKYLLLLHKSQTHPTRADPQ